MKKFLLIFEAAILILGTLLSLTGTSQAVKYSDSYKIYYLLAVLGILFVGVLEFLRKKKYVLFLGIALILNYFIIAGSAFLKCVVYADQMSFLKHYEGKKIAIYIGNETYEWNGEAFFDSTSEFEVIYLDGKENYCEINGEKQAFYTVRMRFEEPDKVYCPMHGIADFRNLIFVKCKN